MGRRNKNQLFEGVKVVDTASKGKSVAKTDDGAIIFLTSGVPGDVVDISTYKKRKGFLSQCFFFRSAWAQKFPNKFPKLALI